MEMTLVSPPPDWHTGVLVAMLWFFPIGAIVMRKHLAHATGATLFAKLVLFCAAWITGPFAVLVTVVIILPAIVETFATLQQLLQAAW